MRTGYKRGELDRVWGKILMDTCKAEEVRRGELRAWFRRMTRFVTNKVQLEFQGLGPGDDHFEEEQQVADEKHVQFWA